MEKVRKQKLENFSRSIGVKFHDLSLLDLAFHHRSFSNESTLGKFSNNERLEFLGDSVLGIATAAFLYKDMENNPEGDLAKIKSNVVSEASLAPVALELGLDKLLVLGKGEEMTGGRTKKAILADCVEAVIGAVYLDNGYKAAEKFVLSFIVNEIRKVQEDRGNKDYKSLLQETLQKKKMECPKYILEKMEGPDHDRTFYVSVEICSKKVGPVTGKNKKEAEQKAAEKALGVLNGKL